jgi:hypothetical protein
MVSRLSIAAEAFKAVLSLSSRIDSTSQLPMMQVAMVAFPTLTTGEAMPS